MIIRLDFFFPSITNLCVQNTDAWRKNLRRVQSCCFLYSFLFESRLGYICCSSSLSLFTCEGALQERPPLISPIRAAAVGLLELMRTGPLISMEWRWGGGASMGLWDMVREVKECRFLLFFFSPTRWAPLLRGPEEAPSPESPLESDGLSNSMSWRAAVLNYEKKRKTIEIVRAKSIKTSLNLSHSIIACHGTSLSSWYRW